MSFDDLIRDMDADILDTFGVPAVILNAVEKVSFGTMVVIDRDIHVLSDDGYTTVNQTHASFNPPAAWKAVRGNEIVTALERLRLVSPISSDGSMSSWVVQKISDYDVQDITDVSAVLDSIVNEDW